MAGERQQTGAYRLLVCAGCGRTVSVPRTQSGRSRKYCDECQRENRTAPSSGKKLRGEIRAQREAAEKRRRAYLAERDAAWDAQLRPEPTVRACAGCGRIITRGRVCGSPAVPRRALTAEGRI